MRIVIESEERAATTAQPVTPLSQTEPAITVIDAGAPSASLLQSVGASAPPLGQPVSQSEGIDAGPPAETLVQAIENAARPLASAASASYFDAGAAPSREDMQH
jgi:hypothetical protein